MSPIFKVLGFLLFSILLTLLANMTLVLCGLSVKVSSALATLISGIVIILFICFKNKALINFSKINFYVLVKYLAILFLFRALIVFGYWITGYEIKFFTFTNRTWNLEYYFNIVGSILFAPFVEEIVFRGIASEYLLSKNVNKYLIIVLTSIVFGLSHLPGVNFFLFFSLFGAILSFLYLKERNLWYCIILHCLFNLSSLFIF